MPDHAAEVTTAFIRSENGVRQSLYVCLTKIDIELSPPPTRVPLTNISYLGKHELEEVTSDMWSDDLWGVSPSATSSTSRDNTVDRPSLCFLWGENDHWVDDRSRDKLITTRGRQLGEEAPRTKPYMEIAARGIPHAFCIRKFLLWGGFVDVLC